MADRVNLMTPAAFDRFAQETANADRLLELIDGEVIDVSSGRTYRSKIADLFRFELRLFCREHDIPCHTSGERGEVEVHTPGVGVRILGRDGVLIYDGLPGFALPVARLFPAVQG
jgi:hypothetical protein